jgi:hypothetical protein
MSTELEDGLKNLGFDITQGEPPAELNMETPEVSPVPEDQQESVIDLSGVFQQEQQTAPEADSSESSLQEESTTEEPPQEVPQVEEDSAEYTDAELESAITSFIGERLGLNLESVDQLAQLMNELRLLLISFLRQVAILWIGLDISQSIHPKWMT